MSSSANIKPVAAEVAHAEKTSPVSVVLEQAAGSEEASEGKVDSSINHRPDEIVEQSAEKITEEPVDIAAGKATDQAVAQTGEANASVVEGLIKEESPDEDEGLIKNTVDFFSLGVKDESGDFLSAPNEPTFGQAVAKAVEKIMEHTIDRILRLVLDRIMQEINATSLDGDDETNGEAGASANEDGPDKLIVEFPFRLIKKEVYILSVTNNQAIAKNAERIVIKIIDKIVQKIKEQTFEEAEAGEQAAAFEEAAAVATDEINACVNDVVEEMIAGSSDLLSEDEPSNVPSATAEDIDNQMAEPTTVQPTGDASADEIAVDPSENRLPRDASFQHLLEDPVQQVAVVHLLEDPSQLVAAKHFVELTDEQNNTTRHITMDDLLSILDLDSVRIDPAFAKKCYTGFILSEIAKTKATEELKVALRKNRVLEEQLDGFRNINAKMVARMLDDVKQKRDMAKTMERQLQEVQVLRQATKSGCDLPK
ncbi:hypothetical protein BZA05DRAFT_458837 [Tricharina praecox]|uniref:uncharacterized protein n=1 Tax=Tricharina praecox TaxID=43433 RepID=UPI00221ECB60|nr:uncharacterized protein BZA05DRAFT_458837 [Tricharina praecox]KAI5845455.1 hypothetical protein BZA05DRAFT_458837 [Tricharina praecox]